MFRTQPSSYLKKGAKPSSTAHCLGSEKLVDDLHPEAHLPPRRLTGRGGAQHPGLRILPAEPQGSKLTNRNLTVDVVSMMGALLRMRLYIWTLKGEGPSI